MSKLITCPSGLSGEIRGLKGNAFEILGDKKRARDGLLGNALFNECWLSTRDIGPYDPDENGNLDWDKVLVGDRTYILAQIRVCMYGPEYAFRVPCQTCKEPIKWTLDLRNLPVRKLASADLEAFKSGNRIRGELPDGRGFFFRLPVGADEAKGAKFGSAAKAFVPMLVARIHSIDEVPETETLRRYFEGLEWGDIFAFAQEMDAHDCGVETEVEVVCEKDECGVVQDVNVPFGRAFLLPDPSRKPSRTTE